MKRRIEMRGFVKKRELLRSYTHRPRPQQQQRGSISSEAKGGRCRRDAEVLGAVALPGGQGQVLRRGPDAAGAGAVTTAGGESVNYRAQTLWIPSPSRCVYRRAREDH